MYLKIYVNVINIVHSQKKIKIFDFKMKFLCEFLK
jgi:hypothetical protein